MIFFWIILSGVFAICIWAILNSLPSYKLLDPGHNIPDDMIEIRDSLFKECLYAALTDKFEHGFMTWHIKGNDRYGDEDSFRLTDSTWAYGVQPYKPFGRDDGIAFTKKQSAELAEALVPTMNKHRNEAVLKAIKELQKPIKGKK